jgi:hypothetical protein
VALLKPLVGEREPDPSSEQNAHRLFYIRAVFVLVEAFAEQHRRLLIELADTGVIAIPEKKLMALREIREVLSDDGTVEEQQKYLHIYDKIKTVYKAAGDGFGQELNVTFGDHSWTTFKAAMELRNQVTHPKRVDDCWILRSPPADRERRERLVPDPPERVRARGTSTPRTTPRLVSRMREQAAETIIEAKRLEIRDAMRNLGRAIQCGDNRELVYWIMPDILACAHRPLRYDPVYGGSRRRLSSDAVLLIEEWVELLHVERIRSILSLMHDGDTDCYRSLPLGDGDLLAYLESRGFIVARHPYEDPAHKRTAEAQARKLLLQTREEALRSFDQLPKPVLISCSAGQDRSAPVAAYIYAHRHQPK